MAGPAGFEPVTSAVTEQRSNLAELRPHNHDSVPILSVKDFPVNKSYDTKNDKIKLWKVDDFPIKKL